jgi:hypothetical protein
MRSSSRYRMIAGRCPSTGHCCFPFDAGREVGPPGSAQGAPARASTPGAGRGGRPRGARLGSAGPVTASVRPPRSARTPVDGTALTIDTNERRHQRRCTATHLSFDRPRRAESADGARPRPGHAATHSAVPVAARKVPDRGCRLTDVDLTRLFRGCVFSVKAIADKSVPLAAPQIRGDSLTGAG